MELDRFMKFGYEHFREPVSFVFKEFGPMAHDLANKFEAYFFFLWINKIFDGESIVELIVCVFEEEGVLTVGIGSEVADSLYAEYLDGHVVGGIILIKQTLVS
jgi:hypothetical protein